MELNKSTDIIEREKTKIQSMLVIKKCLVEPIEKLLVDTSDKPIKVLEKQRFYLANSKSQLAILSDALRENRCINNEVKSDVEETVQVLKRVIPLLEEKIEMFNKSIAQKNKEIDISDLSKFFDDPKLFQDMIQDILVVYEEPSNNIHFGDVIRSIIIDLNKIMKTRNFIKLHDRVMQCEMYFQEVELRLKSAVQIHKDDLVRVHTSLARLLEMCKIVNKKAEKEIA